MATIDGTGSVDTLFGTFDADLIRGKGGADYINGWDGDDRLKGGGGDDVIIDGTGGDRMWGGNGSDTFRLVADGEKDWIKDWETNDVIDLKEWGVTQMSDLTFTTLGNGQIQISFGDEVLQIKAKGGGTLTQSSFANDDFEFAPTPPFTIDFEDLSIADPRYGAPIEIVHPGYAGMEWSENFYFAEDDDIAAAGLIGGHTNRVGTDNVFAMAGFGSEVWFKSNDNFDFEEMEIGALYNDGMTIRIVGMDDGVFVGQEFITIDSTSSTIHQLDDNVFDSVDQVVMVSYGGTLNTDYATQMASAPDTSHFYIDDLVIA